jgi:hypothetical protein
LTLNKHSNEVYKVTTNNETPQCNHFVGRLSKPIVARLVPGWEPLNSSGVSATR